MNVQGRKLGVIAVVVSVLMVGLVVNASAHGGDSGKVHGCITEFEKFVRVVAPGDECKSNEMPIDWNIAGVPGPQGRQGEQGKQGPQGERGPAGPAFTGVAGLVVGTIDGVGDVGSDNALAIGADGLGLISYYDNDYHDPNKVDDGDLRVAHCDDVACASATTHILDSVGDVGRAPSIAVGADGLGLISYHDFTNRDLKVAHCDDVACTTATTHTIDSAGFGGDSSLAIGADGLGLISYRDGTNGDLKVAHCNDAACTTATTSTIDSVGSVGWEPSIAIGADGLGLITYYLRGATSEAGVIKVAHCNDVACSTAGVNIVNSTSDASSGLAIGADGLALIGYYSPATEPTKNGTIEIAHCENVTCTTFTRQTLASPGFAGSDASIALGADDLPLISYSAVGATSRNTELKVAHCDDVLCAEATIHTVDSDGVVVAPSVAVGGDDLGLISYYDLTNGDLKVAHCGFVIC